MGASDVKSASFYFKKLTQITVLFSVAWNAIVFLLTPLMLRFYSLNSETVALTLMLVVIHNIFNAIAFPFSGCLGNGLRAAGDVRFTMIVSVASTIVVRLVLSYLFGVVMKMGVIGIAWAMVCDWSVRAVLFIWRYKQGKWQTMRVI
jgi:Na+-driven multidrug efflux pump